MNNDCGCTHGSGIVPATVCCKQKPTELPVKLATVNYPAQYGTDEDGEPYAPQYGKFTNTIVVYAANNARYIYDGQGEYTKIISDDQFNVLEAKLTAQLNEEITNRTAADESLQENTNQLANKEAEDIENLQTNINTEVNRAIEAEQALNTAIEAEASAREDADTALNTRIDEVINSPDVRYIVESYADLEALDKATVGDQDYARVLVDETHDGQSTFYQFSKANNDWTYIGAAGAYYTKTEVDDMLSEKQDTLVDSGTNQNLKTINGESILGTGNLEVGSNIELYDGYSTATDGANTANFINTKLNSTAVVIGSGASTARPAEDDIVIGKYAKASYNTTLNNIAIGTSAVCSSQAGTAVGYSTQAGNGAVAMGSRAKATSPTAVAIGNGASSTYNNNISIGTSATAGTSNTTYFDSFSSIAIGNTATAANGSIAIGKDANVNLSGNLGSSVALGNNTQVTTAYSVALGYQAVTSRDNEVSVGSGKSGPAPTRFIANVKAGVLDTDAVNVAQLNTAVGDIETALTTLNTGTGV